MWIKYLPICFENVCAKYELQKQHDKGKKLKVTDSRTGQEYFTIT